MQTTSFEFVPREEVPAFIVRLQEESDTMVPPTVPPALSSNEILTLSLVGDDRDEQQPEPPRPTARTRLYLKTTNVQRQILFEEYTTHGDTKPVSYYQEKTRLLKPTLKRLLKKLQAGEDILSPRKPGRKQKHTPELLKAVASKLCAENMTLRGAQNKIIQDNIDAVGENAVLLPEVSVTTIHRYVTNDQLMNDVDIGPISFTEVTPRGPAANSTENKELRIARRKELDAHIRAGFLPVFVDESHWSVGNVRTRSWGPKGEKHFRMTNTATFSLSCICSVSQSGDKFCKIFNTTITNDVFTAYMREFIALCRLEYGNVVFVMDNASIHRRDVRELAERNGCKVLYNAPYSPECNPIELVFGIWKTAVGKLSNVDVAVLLENISQ